jgi:hypothetical protein
MTPPQKYNVPPNLLYYIHNSSHNTSNKIHLKIKKLRLLNIKRFSFCKEIFENKNLSDSYSNNRDSLHNGPPQNTLIQILSSFPSLRLPQPVVSLIVQDCGQRFVYVLG